MIRIVSRYTDTYWKRRVFSRISSLGKTKQTQSLTKVRFCFLLNCNFLQFLSFCLAFLSHPLPHKHKHTSRNPSVCSTSLPPSPTVPGHQGVEDLFTRLTHPTKTHGDLRTHTPAHTGSRPQQRGSAPAGVRGSLDKHIILD